MTFVRITLRWCFDVFNAAVSDDALMTLFDDDLMMLFKAYKIYKKKCSVDAFGYAWMMLR